MGQGREGIWVLGRPDGFGSSNFAQIVNVLMLYRSIWVSGADFIKHMDFLAEEGSTFDDFPRKPSAEIDVFALAKRGDW